MSDASHAQRHTWRAATALVAIAAAVFASPLGAAEREKAKDDKIEVLPRQEVTLETSDGLTIVANYYPSTLGKKAIPVLLLHASRSSRSELEGLALRLQQAGHAVVVPDLRGHGDSSRLNERAGELRAEDYQDMVDKDLEAVKRFLVARNNAGELNVDKLCLVGVEMGAEVAIHFAASDWDWPVLATGKQGQDVKAMVLVSPEWTFKGLRIQDAVNHPAVRSEIAAMIIVGKANAKLMAEARRLHSSLERHHAAAGPEARQTLFMKTPTTSLQGTRLVNEKSMGVDAMILKFIDLRLVSKSTPWAERPSALK